MQLREGSNRLAHRRHRRGWWFCRLFMMIGELLLLLLWKPNLSKEYFHTVFSYHQLPFMNCNYCFFMRVVWRGRGRCPKL